MTLVNTETGEIVGRDAQSVVQFLENAKWMLDAAVEMTGPADVALLKAQVVMADTYARELSLSKDIQEQSREMVRRAEYALGRAIRKAQGDGLVAKDGERLNRGLPNEKTSSESFFNGGGEQNAIYAIASAAPDDLEAALDDAKSEGNLSRANVVRKIKGQQNPAGLSRRQRADLILDLAEQGHTSHQMSDAVGVTSGRVREIARSFDIDIPADRAVGRGGSRIDHTAAVEAAVTRLDNFSSALKLIDFTEVDATEADEWVASLTNSLAELRRFINKIKETTHV